jgi:hypothetical protein
VSAVAIKEGPPAVIRPVDPKEVERLAKLAFWRAKRVALLERLQAMGAEPLVRPMSHQLFNARIDALRALDGMIAELESAR